MTFAKGENVGPYRIIEQLGQGGMATVYKAYHPALDRYVAIKALHPAIMEDPNFLERFKREAKVVAQLEHPNIVPIYDFAEHGGRPYLVMKFIEGETLKARLARGPLSRAELVKIVDAVGQALSYAHARGYLHRDIKPSNILICPDGSIYLADFGLARIAEAGASTLSGDMLMGTPHYISPEQARGELDLDAGTDIYSFGVILYELIVGRVPFTSDTPFSIIHDHIYTPLPLPRKINPKVPEQVERVLLKSLAKERNDRFQTVEALVDSFRASISGEAVSVPAADVAPVRARDVRPSTPVSRDPPAAIATPVPTAKPSVKSRTRWIWVAAGMMIACLALLAFISTVGQAQDQAEIRYPDEYSETLPGFDRQPEDLENADPELHMQRAEELLTNGDPAAAFEELIKAADSFLDAGEFVPAADLYLWALGISSDSLGANAKIAGKLTQALFLGAHDEAMWPHIASLQEDFPEKEMLMAIEARSLLYRSSLEEARAELDLLLKRAPDFSAANVVLVEYHILSGDYEAAWDVIDLLESDQKMLPWLLMHLESLKREIPL
jgi:tRNA A-37 threonylcarbamoyl transferase component Bud32